MRSAAGSVSVGAVVAMLLATGAGGLAAQRPVPVLTAKQNLRIDATDQNLSRVTFIDIASDGTIALGQDEDGLVRFFDAHGRPAGTFGHKGQGPGEFNQMRTDGMVADTLWILDFRNNRITFISPDHRLLRSAPLFAALKATPSDSVGLSGTIAGIPVDGVYGDGSFISRLYLPKQAPRPSWYPAHATGDPVVIADARGVFRRLVAIDPTIPPECEKSGSLPRNGSWGVTVPFCYQARSVFAPDASRYGVILGTNATGPRAGYRLVVIASRGDTVVNRIFDYAPIAISGHVADSMRQARLTTMRGEPPPMLAALKDMALPATYPPVHGLLLGRDGTIWIEQWAADASHHWLVLDPKGNPTGELTVPHNITIHAAERGQFWGIDTDADGLQSVVRYQVQP